MSALTIQGCTPVLGTYLHGLFEQPEIVAALFGKGPSRSLEDTFEALADSIETHIDVPSLLKKAMAGEATARVA